MSCQLLKSLNASQRKLAVTRIEHRFPKKLHYYPRISNDRSIWMFLEVKSMASEDLANVTSEKFIHLTTIGRKTHNPHTVELWFAIHGNSIYLSHEGKETHWMKNIRKSNNVTFEIGGRNFSGNARPLEDGTEESWTAKVWSTRNTTAKERKRSLRTGSHYQNFLQLN